MPNPVRAPLVARAADWRWSSVHALLDPVGGDGLTVTAPALARLPDIASWLETGDDYGMKSALRRAETTGRPIGTDAFLAHFKATLGRDPKPAKRGPKVKSE